MNHDSRLLPLRATSQLLSRIVGVSLIVAAPTTCVGEIKADERVVFFPTTARLSDDGTSWIVPIHGWIFEPEQDDRLRNVALRGLSKALGLDDDASTSRLFHSRAGMFLVDNQSGKRVEIRIGTRRRTLRASDRDGHFSGWVTLPANDAPALTRDGRLMFRAVAGDGRVFEGSAYLIEPTELSVISDIDDTIKVTEVTDLKKAIENTLLRPFRAVDGMAEKYRKWADADVRFHFVSSSPWQLYEPLQQFMRDSGFPDASFHLRRVRLKDSSLLKMLGDPLETKPPVIEKIVRAYPQRQFVLIGDSGEKDPEVYALIAKRYPQQIRRIYIRDVTSQPASGARYRKAFEGLPKQLWQLFDHPQSLNMPTVSRAVPRGG